jgi:hypothetical protein
MKVDCPCSCDLEKAFEPPKRLEAENLPLPPNTPVPTNLPVDIEFTVLLKVRDPENRPEPTNFPVDFLFTDAKRFADPSNPELRD